MAEMVGAEPNQTRPAPEEFHAADRKRKRKALSCFECRRRKLRCDRNYPLCSRCVAQGQTCTYETGPPESAALTAHSSPKKTKNRIDVGGGNSYDSSPSGLLETAVENGATPAQDLPIPIPNPAAETGTWQHQGQVMPVVEKLGDGNGTRHVDFHTGTDRTPQPETIYFKGSDFTTQYYGGTNPTSQISHFPELRMFMKDAMMQHTSLPRVQRELKALQVRWKSERAQALSVPDSDLVDLLPERATVDHLCRLYFTTIETTYRILHAPSFWKEYQAFWENPKMGQASFIVTMLLMMATVACISSEKRSEYIGDSSSAREMAVLWIDVTDDWVNRQSQKHTYLAVWQIRCLLLLATLPNTLKKKRTWTQAGALLRFAMSAGFHRDPGLLGSKISVFDQEMRRRLWATMVELELQISVDRGMPSASAGIPSDTLTPLNIGDNGLDEETTETPTQKSKDTYTTASFLHISRKSLALRVALNSKLNGLASQLPYEEMLMYDEKINQHLKELPSWTNTSTKQRGSKPLSLPGVLLDIQLRQFLLMLHGPYARRSESNSRCSLSKIACFNAAGKILELHSELATSGNYALALLRHDIFRSAVLICHFVYVSSHIEDDVSLSKLSEGFYDQVSAALSILEERITRLGTGYTHYWYVSAANSLINSKSALGNYAAQKKQAIDQVLRQYYKVLASQEEFQKVKDRKPFNAVHKSIDLDTVPQTFDQLLDTHLTQHGIDPTYPEYYFGDPAAWVFDNLPIFDQCLEIPEL